jgi:hypothetical protein
MRQGIPIPEQLRYWVADLLDEIADGTDARKAAGTLPNRSRGRPSETAQLIKQGTSVGIRLSACCRLLELSGFKKSQAVEAVADILSKEDSADTSIVWRACSDYNFSDRTDVSELLHVALAPKPPYYEYRGKELLALLAKPELKKLRDFLPVIHPD